METEQFMQAVLQSFLDADLRVEVLPRSQNKSSTVNTGTSPSQARYDATTQAADERYTNKRLRPENVRMNVGSAAPAHANSTTQAIDGRYATVYKVNHCKMTPTSPPLMTSEFPPQRSDVSYGGDNFQVGGTGSGETGSMPIKSSSYRGGLNWPSRGAVYTPRASRCSDSFASSLRKYPSISPERSSEVFERLVNYSVPKSYRSPCSPHHSPRRSPRRSPPREPISYRTPKTYEETYAANMSPRAPEDCPTRDKRDDIRKQLHTKQGDIRLIREVSRRLRKTLKSISSYSPTQTLSSGLDRNQEWCDTPIPETSETDHEQEPQEPRASVSSHLVNTTVQAVAPTTSLGVETKFPSSRTIAVPVSPSPSSRLSHRTHNLPVPVTRSVQTFEMPRRSIDTITSTTELTRRGHVKVVIKKSKSLSDFRLNRDFKSEILAWLDDFSNPKFKDIQDTVLRNLRYRLKGSSITGAEKIKVKFGNCLKHKLHRKHPSSYEVNEKRELKTNTESQDKLFSAEDYRIETDQSIFEDVIKDWLSDICIKKRDIFLRPVKKDQIYNTFVNRLKHVVFEKSRLCREELLRAEISEILDEVPIEVNNSDKTVYLSRITDALVYRLGNIPQIQIKTKPFKYNMPDKFNTYLRRNRSPRTERETKDVVDKAVVEVLKTQNAIKPNMIKQTIVDLVDKIMNPVNTSIGLKEIATVLHNATKISEKEAFQFAAEMIENCKDLNNKYADIARSQPLAVFMVHRLSRDYLTKTSGTNMSQHSIGSIVDKDIEDNLKQYKKKLAQQIDRWLSDLAVFRGNDTDFRQAVVLDLAGDIIDRQKYLEFSKDRDTDVDELEHLKYQIFKWMKRYVGEDNLEAVEHAVELMEMIRNIPVPVMNISQYHLCKSNSGMCCKDRFGPCTSTDVTNMYGSKSDSGICNRESLSGLASTHTVDNVDNIKDYLPKQRREQGRKSMFNRWNVVLNLSRTSVHEHVSEFSKFNNLKNSCETLKDKDSIENTNGEDIHSTQDQTNQSTSVNREIHISQDTITARSQDNPYKYQCFVSCRDDNFEPAFINNSNNDKLNLTTNPIKYNDQETQNDPILINYMVHKVSNSKTNDLRKQKHQTPSTSRRKNSNTNMDTDSSKPSSKNKRNSREKSQHTRSNESNTAESVFVPLKDADQAPPGPSEQRIPVSSNFNKPSSATAKLMADWRPPPVYIRLPPGRPLINQLHEDFQEYLKNWCQEIPITSNTPEEIKMAEKARLGILNGIWKIITKIKTQPAVFQNKFYYEDVLGKEIDELLDCLPQTEELQQKRYALKAQLLEKNSEMNELIRELQIPENYKELVTEKVKQLEDEKFRRTVNTKFEDPTKMYEELLKYCILDDFLADSDYKETDKISAKAYEYKLQKSIEAYMDELKKKYRKEMEDLTSYFNLSDFFEVLYKVPLPTEDSIKENADKIILELEIDEWMKDLPLVKNDEGNEQRHRRRLRDELTNKIQEMEKRVNITDCCGDTQIKHEISVFLEKVPLEKDQDLKINEMVEELTNRLKRQAAGGRRKSVAFQDGHLNQSTSRSKRQNIGPDMRCPPVKEWALQNDDNVEYRDFQNAPLCSTRIDQPGDEWAIEEDEDAQYRALFKNKPACSSMIEPQAGYGEVNASMLPHFHNSYDQNAHFNYNPGQFHESFRGGTFEFPQGPTPPHFANKFEYPNLVSSRRGSPRSKFYESEVDSIPNASFPDDQYQSVQRDNQYQSVQGPHSFVSMMDADQAPAMIRRSPFNPPPPPNIVWEEPNEASGFVSMEDYVPPGPQMQMSERRFSNGQPQYKSHRSQFGPNMSKGLAASFHASGRNEQPFVELPPLISDASRFTRTPNASRSNRIEIDRNVIQEPLEPSVHQGPRFSIGVSRAAMSHGQEPDVIQPIETSGFVSIASRNRPPGEIPAAPLENSARYHATPAPLQTSARYHATPAPLEISARNQSLRRAAQPSIRIHPAPLEFRRSTDREGIQEIINQNRSARSAQDIQPQPSQEPQISQLHTRHAPTDRLAEAAGAQSSPQRSERRFIASNAPSSEISNQPGFYSTPDQRANLAPPNMRERRQLEKERAARRLYMEAEDNEGEERCHCRERFKRWRMRGPNCSACEDCVHGYFPSMPFPYPPYPYPYMPYGRPPPPYPPHCRR